MLKIGRPIACLVLLLGASAVQVGALRASLAASSVASERDSADIRAVYERLARLTAGSSEPLTVQLDDFRAYSAKRLGEVPVLEALTPAEAHRVEIRRSILRVTSEAGVVDHALYLARWRDAHPDGTAPAEKEADVKPRSGVEGSYTTNDTLADLPALLAQRDPAFAGIGVTGLTSYRVRVQLGTRTRTYRAAALWLAEACPNALAGPSGRPLMVVDHGLSGLTHAANEELPPAPDLIEPDPDPDPDPSPSPPPPGSPECLVTDQRFPDMPTWIAGTEEHTLGRHFIQPAFTFVCRCDATCRASCNVEIGSFCREEEQGDFTVFEHVPGVAHDRKRQGRSYPESLQNGASCGAASGCSIRSCLFGSCGVSVGINISGELPIGRGSLEIGPQVTFAADPNAIFSAKDESGWGCEPCRLKPKKKARKSCRCTSAGAPATGAAPQPTACSIEPTCEDALPEEGGYDTCEEAIDAEPDPPCGPSCGNGACESGETCSTCASDCGPCPPSCGNGACESGETCSTCASDCGPCPPSCGNGFCDFGETCSTCPFDCGPCLPVCGNGLCESGESQSNCCFDCGCPAGHDCGTNGCTCAVIITEECGTFFDACGNFHDLGACPAGESCIGNVCQPDGGGGGGGGGGGCCDPDGDGWVTESECTGCCGGFVQWGNEGGFCILLEAAQTAASTETTLRVIPPNPVPTLTSLSTSPTPPSAATGFTLTVNGKLFVAGAVVRIGGIDRVTTFISAGQVRASVPAAGVPSGTQAVTVFNPAPGGGTSNAIGLTVAK